MKKIISLVLVLMLCVALSATAMAGFAPSVTYEEEAKAFLTEATFDEGIVTEKLIVTTELDAEEKTTAISQEERDLLLDVIKQVEEETMVIPFSEGFVLRELVCIDFVPEAADMAEELKEEGVTLTATFDLGVDADVEVEVFSYIDGEWIAAVSVTNNGDGTVTVVFEDICPVAFAIKE